MTIICITETLNWSWVAPSHKALLRWASSNILGTMYVDQLPLELETDSLVRVEHDAAASLSRECYTRKVLRGVLEELRPEHFLFLYEPAFLLGPLPNPQPVQGVDSKARAYAERHRTRPFNWMTGVPLWCEFEKAIQVLNELDAGVDIHFAQAYCTRFAHDYLNPTNVLMLESCEDVYMRSFEATAQSCNVLVMPWQSHCSKLLEFLHGGSS